MSANTNTNTESESSSSPEALLRQRFRDMNENNTRRLQQEERQRQQCQRSSTAGGSGGTTIGSPSPQPQQPKQTTMAAVAAAATVAATDKNNPNDDDATADGAGAAGTNDEQRPKTKQQQQQQQQLSPPPPHPPPPRPYTPAEDLVVCQSFVAAALAASSSSQEGSGGLLLLPASSSEPEQRYKALRRSVHEEYCTRIRQQQQQQQRQRQILVTDDITAESSGPAPSPSPSGAAAAAAAATASGNGPVGEITSAEQFEDADEEDEVVVVQTATAIADQFEDAEEEDTADAVATTTATTTTAAARRPSTEDDTEGDDDAAALAAAAQQHHSCCYQYPRRTENSVFFRFVHRILPAVCRFADLEDDAAKKNAAKKNGDDDGTAGQLLDWEEVEEEEEEEEEEALYRACSTAYEEENPQGFDGFRSCKEYLETVPTFPALRQQFCNNRNKRQQQQNITGGAGNIDQKTKPPLHQYLYMPPPYTPEEDYMVCTSFVTAAARVSGGLLTLTTPERNEELRRGMHDEYTLSSSISNNAEAACCYPGRTDSSIFFRFTNQILPAVCRFADIEDAEREKTKKNGDDDEASSTPRSDREEQFYKVCNAVYKEEYRGRGDNGGEDCPGALGFDRFRPCKAYLEKIPTFSALRESEMMRRQRQQNKDTSSSSTTGSPPQQQPRTPMAAANNNNNNNNNNDINDDDDDAKVAAAIPARSLVVSHGCGGGNSGRHAVAVAAKKVVAATPPPPSSSQPETEKQQRQPDDLDSNKTTATSPAAGATTVRGKSAYSPEEDLLLCMAFDAAATAIICSQQNCKNLKDGMFEHYVAAVCEKRLQEQQQQSAFLDRTDNSVYFRLMQHVLPAVCRFLEIEEEERKANEKRDGLPYGSFVRDDDQQGQRKEDQDEKERFYQRCNAVYKERYLHTTAIKKKNINNLLGDSYYDGGFDRFRRCKEYLQGVPTFPELRQKYFRGPSRSHKKTSRGRGTRRGTNAVGRSAEKRPVTDCTTEAGNRTPAKKRRGRIGITESATKRQQLQQSSTLVLSSSPTFTQMEDEVLCLAFVAASDAVSGSGAENTAQAIIDADDNNDEDEESSSGKFTEYMHSLYEYVLNEQSHANRIAPATKEVDVCVVLEGSARMLLQARVPPFLVSTAVSSGYTHPKRGSAELRNRFIKHVLVEVCRFMAVEDEVVMTNCTDFDGQSLLDIYGEQFYSRCNTRYMYKYGKHDGFDRFRRCKEDLEGNGLFQALRRKLWTEKK